MSIFIVFVSCKTAKIKNEKYKVFSSFVELGSIGESKLALNLQNDFKVRAIPKLEKEIRLDIEIVPFNKKVDKLYTSRAVYNQQQRAIIYSDSLKVKPEVAIIQIMDVTGFTNELNSEYNERLKNLLFSAKELQVISSTVVVLTNEELSLIREADSYYLSNKEEKKHIIFLYKEGKRFGSLDVGNGITLANKISSFCWNKNERGKWYIADISDGGCIGVTKSHPKKTKTSKNLYNL